MAPQHHTLPDGRLHFSHGPIDLIIQADGFPEAVRVSHELAWERFVAVLPELVVELAELRRAVGPSTSLAGPVARRMWHACLPFRSGYITAMASVAGCVAEEILACYARPGITRAAVNNGGDIALYLTPGTSYAIGICTDPIAATSAAVRGQLNPSGELRISAELPVRGIATSGWRGRSFSLGIADSVTVLAASAGQADAAATVIANAVNLDDSRIQRAPANTLKDDSDLGSLPVTVDVPPLETHLIRRALDAGLARARELQAAGLIWGVVITCQGQSAHLLDDVAPPGRGPAASALSQLSRISPSLPFHIPRTAP